jgi:predicted HD superfamily hydrolase involved in NAD metabolism
MTNKETINKIEIYLNSIFPKNSDRLKHILNVKKVAISLAKIYEVDLENVIIASLLHDVNKYLTNDENQEFLEKHKEKIDLTKYPKPCFHALSAEIIAKEKFGITDKEILNAIRYHCSGRSQMSKLEKIIFVSDFIEESRDFVTEELRNLAKIDLDKTVYQIMKQTKTYLLKNNEELSSLTENALIFYKDKIGGIE